MGWVVRLVEVGTDKPGRSVDVLEIGQLRDLGEIANLGLTLAEAKAASRSRTASRCRRAGARACHSPAGLLILRRRLPDQRLAGPSGCHPARRGGCAAPAVSLCRLWLWRAQYQLAIALSVDAGGRK